MSIKLISEIASSIMEGIYFTWDCPDSFNSRVAVLDIAMWIGTESSEKGILEKLFPNGPKVTGVGKLK